MEYVLLDCVLSCHHLTSLQDKIPSTSQGQDLNIQKSTAGIPFFFHNLLSQYEEMGKLTRHNDIIPDDEIWVKFGGYHGKYEYE